MTWERWNEYDNLHGSVKGKGSDKTLNHFFNHYFVVK